MPALPVDAPGVPFTTMQEMLDMSSGLGSLFKLVKVHKRMRFAASDVFNMTSGIFIVHTYYFHAEDVGFKEAEPVHHYAVYNAGTRVLFLHPEVRVR